MRLFTALVLPDEAREDLDDFLAPRREEGTRVGFRWTSADSWHLTLAFMPEVADRHLDDLVERLGRAVAKRRPYPMAVGGGGGFPDAGRARVLYAGLRGSAEATEELRRLSTGARAASAKSGAGGDGGRFRAHVTLARLGRPEEISNWVRLLDGYEGPIWRTGEVALIRSHLGEGPRRRPRYEVLGSWQIGARTGSA